jgi:predicted glycoside hydrolase/deacetylase ChbG (UPF0249 family)
MLFVNADDLGFSQQASHRILKCFRQQRIHAASAMTFMADSERAADLAKANQLPTGLHLNLDQDFTAAGIPIKLREHHRAVSNYLKTRKWNQIIYNPFLKNSFDYVFQAQWDEFHQLYGEVPKRVDGHHHMHLCMNMLLSGRLPTGIRIRRNFTFFRGEKNSFNLIYRHIVDQWLVSRFVCTDSFFSMKPIDLERLNRLVSLARSSEVEIMVHPGWDNEYVFLLSPEWENLISDKCNSDYLLYPPSQIKQMPSAL